MNLQDQKREIESRLATARAVHNAAAYALRNGGSHVEHEATAEAADQVALVEAELILIDAAIAHADKLAADKSAAADDQARTEAIEQRRRSLERALNSFQASIATAREIDATIEKLGGALRRWRDELAQGKALLVPLISRGAAESLSSVGVRNLRTEIKDRLVGVGVLADSSLTTADLARTVAEEAERIASRWLDEGRNELQRMTTADTEETVQ